jgi:hypothetical protein
MKCGDPRLQKKECLKMQTPRLKQMVGCMTESNVGISNVTGAILLDYVDGMYEL